MSSPWRWVYLMKHSTRHLDTLTPEGLNMCLGHYAKGPLLPRKPVLGGKLIITYVSKFLRESEVQTLSPRSRYDKNMKNIFVLFY